MVRGQMLLAKCNDVWMVDQASNSFGELKNNQINNSLKNRKDFLKTRKTYNSEGIIIVQMYHVTEKR